MIQNIIRGGLTVLAAFLVFSALRQISLSLAIGVDVFTVAVIVYGVSEGEIAGAIMGMVCGLIIDAFSLGLFGLAGLSKTVTGFLAGFISRKINVQPPGRMIVFAGLLGAADLALVGPPHDPGRLRRLPLGPRMAPRPAGRNRDPRDGGHPGDPPDQGPP